MKKRTVLFLSILSTFLFLMLPHIPAIDYTLAKEKTTKSISQPLYSKDFEKDIVTPFLSIISHATSILQLKENPNSILTSILSFILSLIALVLNILVSVISIIAGLVNTLFNVTVNVIVGILKKILSLGSLLQRILDISASVITGLFGIILDIVVGLITIIKDVIVNLITPKATISY